MQIFTFIVLSVITAPDNVPTPLISKIHLPIVSLDVPRKGKREASPVWGWKPNLPDEALRTQISSNQLKYMKMSQNALKGAYASLKEPE